MPAKKRSSSRASSASRTASNGAARRRSGSTNSRSGSASGRRVRLVAPQEKKKKRQRRRGGADQGGGNMSSAIYSPTTIQVDPALREQRRRLLDEVVRAQAETDLYGAKYRQYYASHGAPMGWRIPRPSIQGSEGGDFRWEAIRGFSQTLLDGIPALDTGMVIVRPYEAGDTTLGNASSAPLIALRSAGANGTVFTAFNQTATGCTLDGAYYTNVTQHALWKTPASPFSVFTDTASEWTNQASGERNGANYPSAWYQLLGGVLHVTVMTDNNATADVRFFNPGSSNRAPHAGSHRVSMYQTQYGAQNVPAFAKPQIHGFQDASTTLTPYQTLIDNEAHLVPTASSRSFTIPLTTFNHWRQPGHMSVADSANGSTGGYARSMNPRCNIGHDMHFGCFMVRNTGGSGQVSVAARIEAEFAVALRPDDASLGLSPLTSALYKKAAVVKGDTEAHSTTPIGVASHPVSVGAHAALKARNEAITNVPSPSVEESSHGPSISTGGKKSFWDEVKEGASEVAHFFAQQAGTFGANFVKEYQATGNPRAAAAGAAADTAVRDIQRLTAPPPRGRRRNAQPIVEEPD